MYEKDIEKLADSSVKKIEAMNRFPPGYLAMSALAGVYLGFGIVLIFFPELFPRQRADACI